MLKRDYRMLAIFLGLALMLACVPISVPTPSVPPTLDVGLLNTTIAQTAAAAATQTFVLLPTSTPTPTATRTPTEVPSATPTFLYLLFSPTVPTPTPTMTTVDTTGEPFSCRVDSQTPKDKDVFAPGANFTTHWQVVNNGTSLWDANSADYRFVGGDTLHKQAVYDFPKNVLPGGSVELTVAMQAPTDPGTYTTRWQISTGKDRFCSMGIRIVVQK
jgi:hypothetical protein